jgi:hypothetical protein
VGTVPDLGVNVANLLRAGYGYGGHKLGLLSAAQMPDPIDASGIPLTSEWISKKMGVGDSPEEQIAQFVGGFISPGGKKAPGRLGAIKSGGEPVPNMDAVEEAKRAFGKTFDSKESGYMTPDGLLLDLSGRHYGSGYKNVGGKFVPERGQPDYLRGHRVVDHREIPESVSDMYGGEGGTAGMRKFMEETNSLRLAPEAGGFETSFVPTKEQAISLANRYRYSTEPLAIDVVHPKTGENLGSTLMSKPSAEQIRDYVAGLLKDYQP